MSRANPVRSHSSCCLGNGITSHSPLESSSVDESSSHALTGALMTWMKGTPQASHATVMHALISPSRKNPSPTGFTSAVSVTPVAALAPSAPAAAAAA
eukprot:CAMPEP_0197612416 /NCGR_PEP_ID=MMETSP1326-20131121/57283_1 /TAXON_ID=1155430 /ORGANISM="Genus nov. species nov., Strain RCC2288" /LENGTH=97 /DNA_ID=CAMNT_0043181177 /DNA_START=106 /DNA_END=395 /DNA_ORIENTATION=+